MATKDGGANRRHREVTGRPEATSRGIAQGIASARLVATLWQRNDFTHTRFAPWLRARNPGRRSQTRCALGWLVPGRWPEEELRNALACQKRHWEASSKAELGGNRVLGKECEIQILPVPDGHRRLSDLEIKGVENRVDDFLFQADELQPILAASNRQKLMFLDHSRD